MPPNKTFVISLVSMLHQCWQCVILESTCDPQMETSCLQWEYVKTGQLPGFGLKRVAPHAQPSSWVMIMVDVTGVNRSPFKANKALHLTSGCVLVWVLVGMVLKGKIRMHSTLSAKSRFLAPMQLLALQ